MTLPSPPAVVSNPLPYLADLQRRAKHDITLAVIHCTELPDLAMARAYGERALYANHTGNSGHYYIDRDGRIEEYVDLEHIANHVRHFNAQSVGFELVNTGRYPHWYDSRHQSLLEEYPQPQIAALCHLLCWLKPQLPRLSTIAGHDALDQEQVPASDAASVMVQRKCDPGPLFPWSDVLSKVRLTRWQP